MGKNIGLVIILCTSFGAAQTAYLEGDKNGDRCVDLRDFAISAAGGVNYQDIALIAANWLNFEPVTWYVDANSGNDSYAGTESQPWKTLARAQTKYSGAGEKVLDGDTVICLAGQYGGFLENIGHRFKTTYKAAPGAKCIWQNIDLSTSSRNLRFEGLEIQEFCDFTGVGGVELVGSRIEYPRRLEAPTVAINVDRCNGVLIKNCRILNCETAIEGSDGDNIVIEGNLIKGVMADTMELLRCNDVNVTSNHLCELHHNRKEFKNTFDEPVGWRAAAQGGIDINDRTNFDTVFTVAEDANTGLLCYFEVADSPEQGSFTAGRDFSFIYSMGLSIRPGITLQSGDLAVRLCSGADCNSGDFEDVPLTNFLATDNDSNNWGMKDIPAGVVTTVSITEMEKAPHLDEVYDTRYTPKIFITTLARGNLIGRFDGSEPNRQVRTIGLVMNRDVGAFVLKIDASKGFYFSDGRHQDFIVGNGRGWRICNNILHDGTAQGIFTSTGSLRDCLIEQNVFYDFQNTSLTNMTLSGSSSVRFNTFLGYKRPRTNVSTGYAPNSSYYFAGNLRLRISDVLLDNVLVHNNICGGTLDLPVDSVTGLPTGYWDYNIVQTSTTGVWGVSPWPTHSVNIAGTGGVNCDFTDFFEDADFSYNAGRVMDLRLQAAQQGQYPWPGDWGTGILGMPERGLGTLDEDEEFILENGNLRGVGGVSVGAYQF